MDLNSASLSRTKQLNLSTFWHVIVPVIVSTILIFIIFVVFTMPDWSLDYSDNILPLRTMAERLSKNTIV